MYPLLGSSRFGWQFTAVDNDLEAVKHAESILLSNPDLKTLITVRLTSCSDGQGQKRSDIDTSETRELPGALACAVGSQSYDFCVCNPPFFSDSTEICPGKAVYGGVTSEMVCPGGELQFVQSMLSDSLMMHRLGLNSCHWYTTMLGKKSSFKSMRKMLNDTELVTAVRTSELVQGRQSRWVLAWSFTVPLSAASMPLRAW